MLRGYGFKVTLYCHPFRQQKNCVVTASAQGQGQQMNRSEQMNKSEQKNRSEQSPFYFSGTGLVYIHAAPEIARTR